MTPITKQDLKQYRSRKKEIAYLTKEIAKGPATLTDSVVGSMQEYPYIERVVPLRGPDNTKHARNQERRRYLVERCEAVDMFIEGIEDSELRMYFTLRYIEGQSWMQVATNVEKDISEDAVKKAVTRYLQKVG